MSDILQRARIQGAIRRAIERFGDDHKAALDWIETERAQHLYIAHNTRNTFVRLDSTERADAYAIAIEQFKLTMKG